MADSEAVELLYRHLGGLPDPDYGTINLLPFAQDSDEVNAVKRRVCEAIVRVFEDGGYSLSRGADAAPPRQMRVQCRECGSLLVSAAASDKGMAPVPGFHTIASIARLNPQCPHKPLTLDDQRRRIEQALEMQE